MDIDVRAKEIGHFLKVDANSAKDRLATGFHENHHAVADDFRKANPQNDDQLLEWYRNTDTYIWELSAYHLDEGFNYTGMIEGIALHLKGLDKKRVLCLGDGIGDLSLKLFNTGLSPFYNDLKGSKTAKFAHMRFTLNVSDNINLDLTEGWTPKFRANSYDAVVALDFLEHVTEVEEWTKEIYKALRKGGQFMAQNAFAIGDDEHGGSIPMHLTRNNRFEYDWIPLLESIGFIDQHNGWWTK